MQYGGPDFYSREMQQSVIKLVKFDRITFDTTNESVEKVISLNAVKPSPREFGQVWCKVLPSNWSLPEESFQWFPVGLDSLSVCAVSCHKLVRYDLVRVIYCFMNVTVQFQVIVSLPAVSVDFGSSFHVGSDQWYQLFSSSLVVRTFYDSKLVGTAVDYSNNPVTFDLSTFVVLPMSNFTLVYLYYYSFTYN